MLFRGITLLHCDNHKVRVQYRVFMLKLVVHTSHHFALKR
jgi:hypothetical protein